MCGGSVVCGCVCVCVLVCVFVFAFLRFLLFFFFLCLSLPSLFSFCFFPLRGFLRPLSSSCFIFLIGEDVPERPSPTLILVAPLRLQINSFSLF